MTSLGIRKFKVRYLYIYVDSHERLYRYLCPGLSGASLISLTLDILKHSWIAIPYWLTYQALLRIHNPGPTLLTSAWHIYEYIPTVSRSCTIQYYQFAKPACLLGSADVGTICMIFGNIVISILTKAIRWRLIYWGLRQNVTWIFILDSDENGCIENVH